MIEEREIMTRLVRAVPAYGPLLDRYLQEQAQEGRTERLIYLETGDFARWLVGTVGRGEHTWVHPFADALEDLLVNGDDETRRIAVIGLIEDIQDACVETNVDPDLFMNSLGMASRAKWFETIHWRFRGNFERWRGSIKPPPASSDQ